MKKYEQYINELNSNKNFIFAVNVKGASDEEIDKLIEYADNYFKNENTHHLHDKKYMKPWALIFNMYNTSTGMKAAFSTVSSPNWGAGYKYMDDIITLDELYSVGFDKVEEHIKIKNDTNKYNL